MSALPEQVDLTDDQPWRPVPMPGSEQPLEIVRLASPRERLTIHARFSAGFERPVAGGYAVSEEFLVLDGELEISGSTYRTGDLVVVPAWNQRSGMRSPRGARVLAWFGGPADFLPAAELRACEENVTVAHPDRTSAGAVTTSSVGTWSAAELPDGDGVLELVTADRTSWRRGEVSPGPGDLVRREL